MITPAETGKEPVEDEPCAGVHSCGEEIDESQEWIREELAERRRRIEAGEEKSYSLDEAWQQLEEFKNEYRRKKKCGG